MPSVNQPIRAMHILSGDLWAGAEVQAFTLLQQLSANTQLYVVLLNDGELAKRLKKANIHTQIIPEADFNSLQILRELIRTIKKFQPDIIHTHRQKENILGSLANIASKPLSLKRARCLRTAHGAPEFIPSTKQQIQIWLDRFVGRHLQHGIIAVSTELASKLAQQFAQHKIHTIPNGVDEGALRQQLQIAEFRRQALNIKHIGIIGRLEPVKRVDIFIDTAALFLNNHPSCPAQFHIIGQGKLRPSLEQQAQNLGISQYVHFHGQRTDIANCIASLDCIIMCSDHEGMPMLALEAMALGTPLLAHNTGGLRELLHDYPELQVNIHQAQAYSEQLLRVIQNPPAQLHLPSQYRAETNALSTLSLYYKLLNIPQHAPRPTAGEHP